MSTITLPKTAQILPDEESLYNEALISSIDDVVISTDSNMVVKTWNKAAEKVYGIEAEHATGKRTVDLLDHEYINTYEEEALKKLFHKGYWKGVVRFKNKSGKKVYLQSVITIVRDAEQTKIGYVGISRNITAYVHARKSLQNFLAILTLLEESFLIADKDLKIVFLRPKGSVQNFFKSNYKVGDDALKYIPDTYKAEVRLAFTKAFKGEIIHFDTESDEAPKQYFNITYAPLKDDLGCISNVCVILKDITVQKEMELLQQKKIAAEKSLAESRKLFEEFMENSPILASLVDKDGFIQYMNPPYLNSFELSKDVIGKNIFEVYPKELAQDYFENNKKVLSTLMAIEVIEIGRLPSQLSTYKVIKFPLLYKDSVMIAGWAFDISEQIATEESLMQLNEHKEKLVSVIAHDVRGPLGINAGFIDTIINDFETLQKETLLNYLEMLKSSITQCFNLTDEMVKWAKTQLNKVNYNPVCLEAYKEIIRIIENINFLADDKNLVIETDFKNTSKIYADAEMFSIALRNFISNAIKFSEAGSVIIIATNIVNDKLKVSVKDFGKGIRKVLVEKLMNKLNYEACFGTKGEKGAGLGLIIAKDYIEKNNGTMFIESEEGNGSTFSFTVPLFK